MKLIEWLKQLFVENEEPTSLTIRPRPFRRLVLKDLDLYEEPSREEYLEWAKNRANEYIERGEIRQGLDSFYSDMNKHIELRKHPYLSIGAEMVFEGRLKNKKEVKKFIEGFK